jgi:hypothetical protein
MNEKKLITNFIKHVAGNDFSTANKYLRGVINEKLKNRIRKANDSLQSNNKNTP